jgi:hypothetical protein
MPTSRSVVSVLLRELGDFSLHPQGRPAGGRLRRPSSAGSTTTRTGAPASPSNPSNLLCRAGRGGGQRVAGRELVRARSRIAR